MELTQQPGTYKMNGNGRLVGNLATIHPSFLAIRAGRPTKVQPNNCNRGLIAFALFFSFLVL